MPGRAAADRLLWADSLENRVGTYGGSRCTSSAIDRQTFSRGARGVPPNRLWKPAERLKRSDAQVLIAPFATSRFQFTQVAQLSSSSP